VTERGGQGDEPIPSQEAEIEKAFSGGLGKKLERKGRKGAQLD